MDTSPVGHLAAVLMERIAEDFGDDASVRECAIVIEVDAGASTYILAAGSDDRPWVQKALLYEGIDSIEERIHYERQEPDQ